MELLIFFVGLSASIFVVVLSLYQWSNKDDVNAQKFHQAGMKISALRRDVKLAQSLETLDIVTHVASYSEIRRECGANHDNIDCIRVKIEGADIDS